MRSENDEISGNPYKGLTAYKETDKNAFFGREDESERLFQLVEFNRLTVVFGESGMGKTSLLNAGLFPRLREGGYRPIRIRLKFTEEAPPLKEQIRRAFEEGLAAGEADPHTIEVESQIEDLPAKPLSAYETLWTYFRRAVHFKYPKGEKKESLVPVLVFDQFEEIFTIGKYHKEKAAIIDELYWLLEDQFPPDIKDPALDKNDKESQKLLYSKVKPQFKVILSLREDYLPHLNGLKDRISSIDQTLFRVVQLNGKQAREIISKPEGGFRDEDTVDSLLSVFYPKREPHEIVVQEEDLEIVPTFLSLLCYQMFEKRRLKITTRDDLDKLLEDYYDLRMEEYPVKVSEFIESKLLTEGGFRTPHYLEIRHPLKKHIERLQEQRILRTFHDGQKEYVEIVHDFLAPIVKERRTRRVNKKTQKYISFMGAVIVVLFFLSLIAFDQMLKAKKQTRIAQVNQLTAQALLEESNDNTKAIRIAEEAVNRAESGSKAWPLSVLSRIGYASYNRPFYISQTRLAPDDTIYSAVFSTDNNYILTAHEDGAARIKDLYGNLQQKFQKNNERINSAVFSPDEGNTLILTASHDGTARLWRRDGTLLKELNHDGSVTCASFSPNGDKMLTASFDNTARLWNMNGTQLHVFDHEARVISAAFSPRGNRILTASWDRTAKLWDLEGNLLVTLGGHENTLSSASFSPDADGKYILTASWDRTARLWDGSGKTLATFTHNDAIISALFSPDGKFFSTASRDGEIKLWNRESKKLKTKIKYERTISTVSFSPDGDFILTAYDDGTAKLWDLQGSQRAQFNKHTQEVNAVAFSPNGGHLFTASYGENAVLWDLKSNVLTTLMHQRQVSAAEFSPDGKSILTVSQSGIARLWDDKGKLWRIFEHKEKIILAIFVPQERFILTADNGGVIKLWTRDGICINTLEKYRRRLSSVAISKDGEKILAVSGSKTVILWNSKGEILNEFDHEAILCKAIFSPDEQSILTISCSDSEKDAEFNECDDCEKGTVILWDLEGEQLGAFNLAHIVSAVFSSDGARVLIALKTGIVIVGDQTGKILQTLDLAKNNRELVSASFSSDGNRILTIQEGGKATLWDLNGEVLADYRHDMQIYRATFAPGEDQILTASLDMTARLWDLNGNLLATYDHNGAVISAAFSPLGGRIVTMSRDGTAKIWMTPKTTLQWLQKSDIPLLSDDEKKALGISQRAN